MAIGIGQLIAAIGDENIEFQNLDQCTEDLRMSGGVTRIHFGTAQPIGLDGTKKLGLVLWVDRSIAAEAMQLLKNAKDQANDQ